MMEEQQSNQIATPSSRDLKKQYHEQKQGQRKTLRTVKWGALVLIIAGLGLWGWMQYSKSAEKNKEEVGGATLTSDERAKGRANAPVTVIEYADFQCPACAAWHPLVGQLLREFPDDVQFVYRYFPLTSIHANAFPTAQAAEAANRREKFWEMYDVLYQKQTEWKDSADIQNLLKNYASQIGLDTDQFTRDMEDKSINDKIKADLESGNRAKVDHTPTFILNGEMIDNPGNYNEFRDLIIAARGK